MDVLRQLVASAREAGLEVVPKLNFSKSGDPRHDHNYWFRPYNELPDDDAYWAKAFELMDEIIEAVRPESYFFVGMDEDFLRTPAQYASAVTALHDGITKRGLRPVMWNDTAHLSAGMFGCVEKTLAAEAAAPGDVVHVVWDYTPLKARTAQRVVDMRSAGLEVWIAPGRRPEDVEQWKRLALQAGCRGLVMTAWAPVTERNRRRFLEAVEEIGPIFARADAVPEAWAFPRAGASHVVTVEMSPAGAMDDPVAAPNRLGDPLEDVPYLLPADVYVRNWMLLGPMPFDPRRYVGPEAQEVIDDDSFAEGAEAALVAGEPGSKALGAVWQRYVPPAGSRFPQIIDLHATYGGPDYALAYAVAHVYSEEDVTGYSIYLGSDDYVKVWLNGRLIHSWAERSRAIGQDDDKIEGIALRKGWNKLTVKCVNVKATWGLILHIADERDRPLVTE
jgi:hypothetical protein